MDRISRRSRGQESILCGSRKVTSLLFADDVTLLAPLHGCLQRALEWFAAECEAVGMRISTSKSESMVLSRKRMVCPLQVEVRSEGSFVKLEVDGSLALMVGLNSLGAPGRSHLRGQMRLSLGAMLMEQEKLYHPLVLPMDGCLAKGNWLNQRNLWETDTKLDAKLCLGDIRRGSHFSGRGLVVFNTSDSHSLPLPPLPAHLSTQGDIIVEIEGDGDIKGLTGSLLNIQTRKGESLVTVISKEEELVAHLGAEVHALPVDSSVETLTLMFSEQKVLVQYGPKSVHFDLKHPQDWRSQWTEGLFLTFGGVPDPSYQRGSDYLLGCVRRIKIQDRDVDLDRALYKDNSISSHSCPHLTAK